MKITGKTFVEGKMVEKVLWEGKFDAENLILEDSHNDLGDWLKQVRFDDSNVVTGISQALYDFMSITCGWLGNDDSKTLLFITLSYKNEVHYGIQAWCKPAILDYDKMPNHDADDNQCKEEQQDHLDELEENGGYEFATFNLELSDTEKIELLEFMIL
ncbi:hypothetical protein [Caproiciproducens sp.]